MRISTECRSEPYEGGIDVYTTHGTVPGLKAITLFEGGANGVKRREWVGSRGCCVLSSRRCIVKMVQKARSLLVGDIAIKLFERGERG